MLSGITNYVSAEQAHRVLNPIWAFHRQMA